MSDKPETMTVPIAPDDTAALVKIVQRVTRFDGCIPATVATAIAEAVCPPGYVVISRADLEDVVSIADEADVYIDRRLAALDRMWELLRMSDDTTGNLARRDAVDETLEREFMQTILRHEAIVRLERHQHVTPERLMESQREVIDLFRRAARSDAAPGTTEQAQMLCPPGYVVVSRADLEAMMSPVEGPDEEVIERLRAALGWE